MNNYLISIIIPVYKTEEFLPETLESIINQTYKNLEIIQVNNGESKKAEEIFYNYKKMYPNFKWKLISLPENVGLLRARLKGFSEMEGEYFATVDSDDVISLDFYYQLLNAAIQNHADVVSADYVHDDMNGNGMYHFPLNDMELCDFSWEGEDILSNFMKAHGHSFNYHAVWCKLYSYHIWQKSQEAFGNFHEALTLNEDILTTTIFASNAQRWINIHGVCYYHVVRSTAATSTMGESKNKILYSFDQFSAAFNYMEYYLKEKGRFDTLEEDFEEYKKRFASIFFSLCSNSNLTGSQKKFCISYGNKLLGYEKPHFIEPLYYFFESRISPFDDGLEKVRKKILDKDITIISFDIFDTLIERPFLRPDDIFEILSIKYNMYENNQKRIDFAGYRRCAERIAREKATKNHPFWRDITLDEIYQELVYEGILSSEEAEIFKEEEINLEVRFCQARKIGKYIYDFAVRSGKKIICVSDMYLPYEVVRNILTRNGYSKIDKIYISSSARKCKSNGLFRKVVSDLHVSPNKICHIGDNYFSDYCAAKDMGIEPIYLSAAREMLMGKNLLAYSGQSFYHITKEENNCACFTDYLGNRCILGMVANKMFWNPFRTFNADSDFDCDLNIIGYYILGSYIFTIAKWILEQSRKKGYSTIHFIARDGLIFKKAYDILASRSSQKSPRSNYLKISRSSLMPLMIKTKKDILALKSFIDIKSFTPLSLLEKFKDIIPKDVYEKRESIFIQNNFDPDSLFESDDQWIEFEKLFLREFYDKEFIDRYRTHFKDAFGGIFDEKDCTFDVGYSARSETLLSEVLGKKIDAFYLHVIAERGFLQAKNAAIDVNVFHQYLCKYWEIPIIEALISSTEEGCIGYEFDDKKIKYIYKESDLCAESKISIDIIHQNATRFVEDFVSIFPEWESMEYRYGDRPFLYFLHHASDFDKGILQHIKFTDAMSSNDIGTYLYDMWKSEPYIGPNKISEASACNIGVKGALVNYFRKHTPCCLRPFAKKIRRLLKW